MTDRTSVVPQIDAALRACAAASLDGDVHAFQVAYLRREGATMRLAREAWRMRPNGDRWSDG